MQTPGPTVRVHRFRFLATGTLALGVTLLAEPATIEAKPIGIDWAFRVGVAAPMGSLYTSVDGLGSVLNFQGNVPLATFTNSMVPIQGDLAFWIHPQILVGSYFQYGIGIRNEGNTVACQDTGFTCSAGAVRIGGQAQFHFTPEHWMDPWLGLGMGAEWLSETVAQGADSQMVMLGGFEFLQLQGGLDFRPVEGVRLGPYLGLSFAQSGGIQQITRDASGTTTREESFASNETRVHEWLMVGVKGACTL